jgi:HlyD family secretion protein
VNEADVGNLAPGQPVSFTVDAFPGQVFHGKVGQVRLNATMTQNVVTYTIEVDTDNADGKLLPYLTANAQFELGKRRNVLLVPNEALRWKPKPGQIAPEPGQKPREKGQRRERGGTEGGGAEATLWVQAGKLVRPLKVTAGLTDGAFTEVEGRNLTEGLKVVLGEGPRDLDVAQAEKNPFGPQRPAWQQQQRSAQGDQAQPAR